MGENHKHQGFSLTEMAIVIVIVGLLVAGIFAGNGLLEQAKLRSVVAEMQNYKVSIEHFQQLYEYLPGDLPNATGSNNYFNGQTTNGDGNGKISSTTPSGTEETFAAWVQLVLAHFTDGSYTGAADSGSATIGTNIPASHHLDGAGYSLAWVDSPSSLTDDLGRSLSGNYLILASDDNNGTVITGSVLSTDQAYYIDTKMDDGKANYGMVLGGGGSCFSGANYTLTTSGKVCYLYANIEN